MRFEYPRRVRFRCGRCALCCGDTETRVRQIILLKTEVDRILEETSMKVEEFAEKIEGSEPYTYRMRKIRGKCIFLTDDLCSVYKIRPIICRFYPFKLESLGKNLYHFSYTNECPGIGRGPLLNKSFFKKLFREFQKSMTKNYGNSKEVVGAIGKSR